MMARLNLSKTFILFHHILNQCLTDLNISHFCNSYDTNVSLNQVQHKFLLKKQSQEQWPIISGLIS